MIIAMAPKTPRQLIVVLGDQLDRRSAAFDGADPALDIVWMAEVSHESTRVPSSRARTVMFLSAMRHFRDALHAEGWQVEYHTLAEGCERLEATLSQTLARSSPQRVVMVEAGEWGLRELLRGAVVATGIVFEEREDRHFLCSTAMFREHARGRKQLRMEFFYREMRRRHGILLDAKGGPEGGEWNYDAENRKSFGKAGPQSLGIPVPRAFPPDLITREVISEVETHFPGNPGRTAAFDWPVTPEQAREALEDFIVHRLPVFGDHQDAMWRGEPWLFHARLSAALNLKLLDPREVLQAAEAAYRRKAAPLAAVEGFIRQILGWREYVRGIYWLSMPDYLERNALAADEPLPSFFWNGETDQACLRETINQTLEYGYAHHIQRLMVTGLFALLLGVKPKAVHEWYLAVYVDAIEWVELPNTLGMSQYADGGVMASKPYVATGKYIERMSNYCAGCRYRPAESTGERACPFTTLYWDFLQRHAKTLANNPRLGLQLRNLERLDAATLDAIRHQAELLRRRLRSGERV